MEIKGRAKKTRIKAQEIESGRRGPDALEKICLPRKVDHVLIQTREGKRRKINIGEISLAGSTNMEIATMATDAGFLMKISNRVRGENLVIKLEHIILKLKKRKIVLLIQSLRP